MPHIEHYTGVGSRKTPGNIMKLMIKIAKKMAMNNIILRSGGADGADSAFEAGCNDMKGPKEIYLANQCTIKAMAIAKQFHHAWNACSEYARKLHGRNAFQVLGVNLNMPSRLLICWTPDGCEYHETRSRKTGGTGTAISIAEHYKVPIYNLFNKKQQDFWLDWINK